LPVEETDSDLARRAAAGDRAAFAALAERHYDRLHALAWRWSGARNEAEDIAQEAMVKIAGAIRGFRGDCAFSTWAYRIAYTTAIDHIRARNKIVPLAPEQMQALTEAADCDPPGDAGAGLETERELWRAVRALPEQQRDAVLLVYGEEMSHAQAATLMGCSEKTVSWHLHAARKRLKTTLEAV
jgi:RNA polymerase sigma-70 factor (ECF subfamily)